jgi:hypothetical protein
LEKPSIMLLGGKNRVQQGKEVLVNLFERLLISRGIEAFQIFFQLVPLRASVRLDWSNG